MTGSDHRQRAAASWAAESLGLEQVSLEPVSGDASFRRYFRFNDGNRSIILMDAPPEKEDSAPFVDIAGRLRSAGLNAPKILEFDLQQGFGLLEDFGDTLYRELISEQSVNTVFPELFGLLDGMACRVDTSGLPQYSDAALAQELDLFKTWYLECHRERPLRDAEAAIWESVCRLLIDSALEQPQVFVHKDFHSCNLLQTPNGPGVIDFQDGVRGPLSYDFVSLVWDRYIAWDRDRLENWMKDVHAMLPLNCTIDEWVRYCDWMGLQRNLKIVGIFARLKHRDGKQGYVEMIPRFYQYLLDVLPRYPEFHEFQKMLEQNECAP
jgi:aminoglycoside/choline kinase family phosphotransferase